MAKTQSLQDPFLNALRKEVGLPGFEADVPTDYGDADFIERIPDIGEDPSYDF